MLLDNGLVIVSSFSHDVLKCLELPDPERIWGRTSCSRRLMTDADAIVRLSQKYPHNEASLIGFMCSIPSGRLFWSKDFWDEYNDPTSHQAQREYLVALSDFVRFQGPEMLSLTICKHIADRLLYYAGLGFKSRAYAGGNSAWDIVLRETLEVFGPNWETL